MLSKITIVGGIPRPVGGVTTFIHRLVDLYPAMIGNVLDLYPEPDKQKISVKHQVVPKGSLIWLFWYFFLNVRGAVYFNFSGPRGLLALALLPKLGKSRWSLTLHNGELVQPRNGSLVGYLMKRGLQKCDLLGVISEKQKNFYLGSGVNSNRIVMISTFVPRDWAAVTAPSESELPEYVSWLQEGCKIFVVSGYPTKIYQHIEILEIFKELKKSGEDTIRLALFLYGSDSDGLLTQIRQDVFESNCAHLYWATGEDQFLSALKLSSGYIRMNRVDSFGIAVADAISLNVPVLATNVCERHPGAILVTPDDFDGVRTFISRCASGSSLIVDPPGENENKIFHFLKLLLLEI